MTDSAHKRGSDHPAGHGLVVSEFRELLALHRSLVIARYDGSGPRFAEVLLSPLMADIARRTFRAIVDQLLADGKTSEAAGWQHWTQLSDDAPQVATVRDALINDIVWVRLTSAERRSRTLDALAPFELAEATLQQLIADVDRAHGELA